MRVIKTIEDVILLKADPAVPKAVADYLEEHLYQLYSHLGGGCGLEEFSLDFHGYMVLVEEGDDVLAGIRERFLGGDFVMSPEFVNLVELPGGALWEAAFLLDNDWVMTYFVQAGKSEPATEEWLRDEWERSQSGLNLTLGG